MATRPQVLRLVLRIHLALDSRRLAQNTQVLRLNICRDPTKGIGSSLSMSTMTVTKSMGGKARRTRSLHGTKLHDHTQTMLPPCPSMIKTAIAARYTRCLIPKSRVPCIRHHLCIEQTPLHHNTPKRLTHRTTITLRHIKITCKPLPKQLQRIQTLYVHLPRAATSNTPNERRC